MRIIITAGHNKSMYAIALMEKLRESGHDVVGCVQVKTFQIRRFKSYLRQYGWQTVKAKFLSHVLNINTFLAYETKPISDYLRELKLTETKTTKYCKHKKINHIKVNSISNKKTEKFLIDNKADIVIYAGGGIIRKNIINISKYGILNAHSGWLPFFRGMNVIEWALLYGYRPYTSIHLVDEGIDTGNIIYQEPMPLDKDLYTIRGNATVHNIILLTKVLNNFHSFYRKSIEQHEAEGRQFFVMHNRLKNLVIKYLSNNYSNINSVLKTCC